jgi:hypothetical protein
MMLNENNRFELNIDKKKFSLLNKSKKISWLFRSTNVGKCAKIFDEYYKSTLDITPSGWFLFYKSVMGIEILKEVSEKIMELEGLDIDTCFNYTKFRVLGQTWNGMLNEIDLINVLRKEFPNIEFRKTDYDLDENYFTDWELYSNGKLILGLQIKPITYMLMNTPYQMQAKLNHEEQMKRYRDKYRVPHFLIYYENNSIYEKEKVLEKINILLVNLI